MTSWTVEIRKLEKVVFARNREIAEKDAVIRRLDARNIPLEAVYRAVKNSPESEQTMTLRYALADLKDKR